jgi:hypothetical protein
MTRVVDDPTLGRFEWDERFSHWCGSLTLPSGHVVQFIVSPATDEHFERPDAPEVFSAAVAVADWLRTSEAEVVAAVADAMVPLYNDTWSEEPPITAEEFAKRIELIEVEVPSDGAHTHFWFADGEMEMFGGHAIDVYFGADRQLENAHLAG